MARIPQTYLRELQERLSVVELVGQYVQLKHKGRGDHWGRCPFHNEKSASFKVNETRKAYKCFGCGKGGGLINFFMEIEGLQFREAVEELSRRASMKMPEGDLSPEQRKALNRKQRLYEANHLACTYFQQVLSSPEGAPAREELARRDIPPELAQKYKLGMAPDSWDGLANFLQNSGMNPKVAEAAGLLLPKRSGSGYIDRFRNRLMFPIRSRDGKVVAFGGRTLGDDRAKYLNSPETEIYVKSRTLFGYHNARQAIQREEKVMVVEGYFDVLGLVKAGLGFAVASCGTALTSDHLTELSRQTHNIVMLFDSDEAGIRAAMKSAELAIGQGLWPTWLSVPDGKDPDDYVRQNGGEAMRELLKNEERPLFDFYLQQKIRAAGSNLHARNQVLQDVAPLLVGQPQTVKQVYEMQVAELVGVDPMVVRQQIRSSAGAARARALRDSNRTASGAPSWAAGSRQGSPQGRYSGSRGSYTAKHSAPSIGSAPYSGPGAPDADFPDSLGHAPAGPAPTGPDEENGYEAGNPSTRVHGGDLEGSPFAPQARPSIPITAAEEELVRLLSQNLRSVAEGIRSWKARDWLHQPDIIMVVDRFLASENEGREPTALDLLIDVQDPAVHSLVYDAIAATDLWYSDEQITHAMEVCFWRLYDGALARHGVELNRQRALLEADGNANVADVAALVQQSFENERRRQEIQASLRQSS